MNGANAVQGNAYVRHAQFLEPRCSFRRNTGAVCGNGHLQPFSSGTFQQFHKARMHQRLPSGKKEGIHLVVRQIINDRATLVPIQLSLKFPGRGVCITMHAFEIAGTRNIPHHNGLARTGRSRCTGFHGAKRPCPWPCPYLKWSAGCSAPVQSLVILIMVL